MAPIPADLIAHCREPGIVIGGLHLDHAALRHLPFARSALLHLLRRVEAKVGMTRALVGKLADTEHLRFERRANGVQQIGERPVARPLPGRAARRAHPSEIREVRLDRRRQLRVRSRPRHHPRCRRVRRDMQGPVRINCHNAHVISSSDRPNTAASDESNGALGVRRDSLSSRLRIRRDQNALSRASLPHACRCCIARPVSHPYGANSTSSSTSACSGSMTGSGRSEDSMGRQRARKRLRHRIRSRLARLCLLFIHPSAHGSEVRPCGAKYPGFCADSKGV